MIKNILQGLVDLGVGWHTTETESLGDAVELYFAVDVGTHYLLVDGAGDYGSRGLVADIFRCRSDTTGDGLESLNR